MKIKIFIALVIVSALVPFIWFGYWARTTIEQLWDWATSK